MQEVVREMDRNDEQGNPVPFSVMFVSCDRTKKSGGEIIMLRNVTKCGLPYSCKENEMRGLRDPLTKKVTPVHLRLIVEFNNERVHY